MSPRKYLLTLTILREENAVVAGNTNRYIMVVLHLNNFTLLFIQRMCVIEAMTD